MTQKNLSGDRRTETMSSPAVAGETGQLGCTRPATEPRLDLSVEDTLRIWEEPVVSRPLAPTARDGSPGAPCLRAAGGSDPSPAQRQGQSLGVLWRRSHLQRVGRVGSASHAQHPNHPSDSGSQPPVDPQARGSLSQGAGSARSDCRQAERCASDGLYRGALSGLPPLCRGVQSKGCCHRTGRRDGGAQSTGPAGAGLSATGLGAAWDPTVSANGQRHEPDWGTDAPPNDWTAGPLLSGLPRGGRLYPRATARLQCLGRTRQRTVARESLAAVPVPHPERSSGAFACVSDDLFSLSRTPLPPSGKAGAVPDPRALLANAVPMETSVAALPWADLVYPAA